jgi:nicotinamide-nucleotide amidase
MSIMEEAAALGLELKKRQWMLVTAESCTGGGLAFWLTSAPGSSAWFERGFVTYSNASKEELLGVKPSTLENWGAVSEETAREMAEGALSKSLATLSLAITGIAGPEGDSPEKPVGTVWFAWKLRNAETQAKAFFLSGNRTEIREQAIQHAVELLFSAL